VECLLEHARHVQKWYCFAIHAAHILQNKSLRRLMNRRFPGIIIQIQKSFPAVAQRVRGTRCEIAERPGDHLDLRWFRQVSLVKTVLF
jgi:hypothetical protein